MADNILWIFCEDLSPWFAAYGDRTVPTPNLDALAEASTVFQRCFAPSPVCSPTRSGVICGCWPTSIGVHNHVSSRPGMPAVHLSAEVRPLPVLMREAGFYTYNMGKDDYNFAYHRQDLYAGPCTTMGFFGEHHVDTFLFRGPESDYAFWRTRPAGQAFFGQLTLWAGKNPTRVAPPTDPAAVRVMPCYPDTPNFRAQIAQHYDQIRTTDAEVGKVIQQLGEDGLLENTWIFFFSDHGYSLERHKQFCYVGGTHVPLLIRPPDRPDSAPWRGRVRSDLVSLLDVTATTLAIADLPTPAWMDSRNLLDAGYRRDFVPSTRDRCDGTLDRIRSIRTDRYRYIRNFYTDRPLMQSQYRQTMGSPAALEYRQLWREGKLTPTAAYYAGDFRPAEELYDTLADPDEVHNLADDPARAADLAEHRAILDRWMIETADRGGEREEPEQFEWLFRQFGPVMCWAKEYDAARRNASEK